MTMRKTIRPIVALLLAMICLPFMGCDVQPSKLANQQAQDAWANFAVEPLNNKMDVALDLLAEQAATTAESQRMIVESLRQINVEIQNLHAIDQQQLADLKQVAEKAKQKLTSVPSKIASDGVSSLGDEPETLQLDSLDQVAEQITLLKESVKRLESAPKQTAPAYNNYRSALNMQSGNSSGSFANGGSSGGSNAYRVSPQPFEYLSGQPYQTPPPAIPVAYPTPTVPPYSTPLANGCYQVGNQIVCPTNRRGFFARVFGG